jgi:hypothetical protein
MFYSFFFVSIICRVTVLVSCFELCPAPYHEPEDQYHHRHDQQQMNQSATQVETEPKQP